MVSSSRALVFGAALVLLTAAPSAAQALRLQFVDGLVNLSAQNVPLRVILAEWARLGGTTIVNGDRVTGPPVSIELAGATERYALDVILRDVPGYMLAARREPGGGASRFDRVMILPTTTATPMRPAPAANFSQAPPPPFVQTPNSAAANQADDGSGVERAELEARMREAAEALRRADEQNRARVVNPTVTARPAAPFEGDPAAPRPLVVPPPGPTPGNPFAPGNPFTTLPGSSTPGTIAPIPPQQPQDNRERPAER